MTQQYGTVKVDFITFTSGTTGNETDITIPVSGLADIAESGINISGDISARNITATGNLSVSGQTLTSGLIVQNNATISGNLGLSGEVTASSVTVTGTLNASGDVNVSGLLTTSGLSVTGTADVNALNVTGLAAVGTLTTTGSATVNGPATLSSGLTVNGDTSTFNDTVTIASGLTVTNGGIVVSNAGGLNVDGDVIFQDNLTVSGTANFDDINASGTTTLNELTVTGAMTFATGLFASGTEAAPSISFVGDTDTGFYNAAANEVRITTNGNDRLTVDNTGNVGIGTTSPFGKLHIQDDTNNVEIFAIGPAAGSSRIRFGDSDDTNIGQIIYDNTNDSLQIHTNNFERLRIASNGNVGIGTSNPATKLNVIGDIQLSRNTTSSDAAINFGSNANNYIFGGNSSNVMTFAVNSSERMRIDSSGRLLVGTTSWSDNDLLAVKGQVGSTTGSAQIAFGRGNFMAGEGQPIASINFVDFSADANQYGSIECSTDAAGSSGSDTPGRLVFSTTADGASTPAERLRIASNGNVGIGTTSPQEKFHVRVSDSGDAAPAIGGVDGVIIETGTDRTGGLVFSTPNDRTGGIFFKDPDSTSAQGAVRYQHANDQMQFTVNGSVASVISSNGNVGIGTTNPGGNLEVKNTEFSSIIINSDRTSGNLGGITIASQGTQISQIYGTVGGDLIHLTSGSYTFCGSSASNERARIDSSGRLLVGTSNARTNFYNGNNTAQIQLEGTNFQNAAFAITCNANSPDKGGLIFAKSRGTAVGSNTVVQDDDDLGSIEFQGSDGSEFVSGANIKVEVDGTPGTNDMPGRLVFSTTAVGASSPTERMRIRQDGSIDTITDAGVSFYVRNKTTAPGNVIFGCLNNATVLGNGTQVFLVRGDGDCENANNSYTGISDIKLKENIVDAGSQWDDLKTLQVRNYNFKPETGYGTHTQIGLIAQEVELVSPGLVNESPDRDEDGNDLGTVTKSVNYSVLYMKAVKALQEAMERIEQLESRLAALENN